MNELALFLSLSELFFIGVMLGYYAGERQDPNAPKPKRWEDMLHKSWIKGYKTGEKDMAKRMSERLKKEEITRLPWGDSDD